MFSPPIPRVPPRFVPTLTEVVQDAGTAQLPSAFPQALRTAGPVASAPSAPTEARAPTPVTAPAAPLPSVRAADSRAGGVVPRPQSLASVQTPPDDAGDALPREALPRHQTPAALETGSERPLLSKDFEELLVHRVMQRVDISLDIRLRGAIATAVEEQTRSIVPRLREEIEAVVRHAVYEAVADELAADAAMPSK